MKVIKKVNNNVAIAINEHNEEVFVVGKGVGFLKTPYEPDGDGLGGKNICSTKEHPYV